ncbi:MAG: alpha-ketoglutarate-dependent dioxygenase AlkB family protein [Alphaproteobacteria bacterium]
MRLEIAPGVTLWRGKLSPGEQCLLLTDIYVGVKEAPFYTPRMPKSGAPFSVRMTNFGPLGWYSDERGYRYESRHPETGKPWPAIPLILHRLWDKLVDRKAPPECCLVNFYREGARMGLHRDADEEADVPVLSVSLGDTAQFRIGGLRRKDRAKRVALASGDVLVFGGAARMAFHGVDRVLAGTSRLIPGGGRINLTLRRVSPAHKKAPGHEDRAPNAPLRAGTGRG